MKQLAQHLRVCSKQNILLISLFWCLGVHAQPMQKPGLWEQWMKSSNMPANMQMPKMSPQQAEQMRKMGIPVPEFRDGGMVSKVCLTNEQMKKLQTMSHDMQGKMNCKVLNTSTSGNRTTIESACDGAMGKSRTKSVFEAQGPDQYTVHVDTEMQQGGQTQQHSSDIKAKWLGADCGSVKPMLVPGS